MSRGENEISVVYISVTLSSQLFGDRSYYFRFLVTFFKKSISLIFLCLHKLDALKLQLRIYKCSVYASQANIDRSSQK